MADTPTGNGQLPVSPVMLRVDLLYRFAFEKAPNRRADRRRRRGESTVYLPYARRERRFVACVDRAMREAMGDDAYEGFKAELTRMVERDRAA